MAIGQAVSSGSVKESQLPGAIRRLEKLSSNFNDVSERFRQLTDRTVGTRPQGVSDANKAPAPAGHIGRLNEIIGFLEGVYSELRSNIDELESAL